MALPLALKRGCMRQLLLLNIGGRSARCRNFGSAWLAQITQAHFKTGAVCSLPCAPGLESNTLQTTEQHSGGGEQPTKSPNSDVTQRKDSPESEPEPDDDFPRLDGISYVDVITLPPRHLLWSSFLHILFLRYPDVWVQQEFYDGVEMAVRTILHTLAVGHPSELEGMVDDVLLHSVVADGVEHGASLSVKQGWVAPPRLTDVKLVGLLTAEGIEDNGRRRLRVSPLVYSQEEYTYLENPGKPVLRRRLQRWTFERSLDDGDHWKVVHMGSKRWYVPRIAG